MWLLFPYDFEGFTQKNLGWGRRGSRNSMRTCPKSLTFMLRRAQNSRFLKSLIGFRAKEFAILLFTSSYNVQVKLLGVYHVISG